MLRHAANAGVVLLMMLGALAGFVAFFSRDLPDTDGLWAAERAPRVTFLDIDGAPISVHGESFGAPIRLSALPPYAPLAVLAVEDRNFYHHIGVNPISVARAIFVNATAGGIVQGGSTITQQLAKNLFLSSDRTLKRKIQELLLALWLEHQFTKDEILTLYLNRVYFGAGAYGIDAASYRYFGKPARQLKVGEAAVLAGLLKAPTKYAPTNNPVDAGQRGRIVIDAMEEARFITPTVAERARREPILLATPRYAAAPYFVDYLMQETRELSRGVDADLVVQTTFDPKLQTALEAGMRVGLAEAKATADMQVAAVIVDPEGAVRAMIGGRNYQQSQFNRATQARRQPGSAFKPFVYLAALEAGYSPEDTVLDAPIAIDKWRPENYNERYYGEVTLTNALAQSMNSAAIRVQEHVGRSAVRILARKMGLENTVTRGPSLALGVDAVTPLELAGAYAPLVNGGYHARLHAIDSIKTADGQLVYKRDTAMVDMAASYKSVRALNAMLAEVVRAGTGHAAAIDGWRVRGKTGTTQDYRDAWFAGHVGGLVGVVWTGRDDNAPMDKIVGGGAPAIIWREAMSRALEGRQPPIEIQNTPGEPEESDPLAALIKNDT
ncbi:MAG TPA: PBP1A family penicillin-binding protein [Amphiplicatus sp.]|nr:PBP1A family penicillin-binding protein [Caulobacterales bacterium]HOP18837.1 PBP1A family penicillin-binding protein [Amphiplicatus sp.]